MSNLILALVIVIGWPLFTWLVSHAADCGEPTPDDLLPFGPDTQREPSPWLPIESTSSTLPAPLNTSGNHGAHS